VTYYLIKVTIVIWHKTLQHSKCSSLTEDQFSFHVLKKQTYRSMVTVIIYSIGTRGSDSTEDPYTCIFNSVKREEHNCKTDRLYIGYRQIEDYRTDFYTTKLAIGKTFPSVPFTTNITLLGTRSKCEYYHTLTKIWKTDGCWVRYCLLYSA